MIQAAIVGDLLDAIETNFITGIMEEATGVLGPIFFVLLGLIVVIPMYNRIGVLPTAVIVLSGVWVIFSQVLPAAAMNAAMGIIILAGAAMITIAFFARRRPYGG